MNKRKIAMMIAGALSIITVFLPYFMVESETILSGDRAAIWYALKNDE